MLFSSLLKVEQELRHNGLNVHWRHFVFVPCFCFGRGPHHCNWKCYTKENENIRLSVECKLLWIICLPVSLLIPAPRGLRQNENKLGFVRYVKRAQVSCNYLQYLYARKEAFSVNTAKVDCLIWEVGAYNSSSQLKRRSIAVYKPKFAY